MNLFCLLCSYSHLLRSMFSQCYTIINKKFNKNMATGSNVHVSICPDHPTVVMLLASHRCMPCQQFAPVATQLTSMDNQFLTQYGLKFHFLHFEEKDAPAVLRAFKVDGVPKILVYSPRTQAFVEYGGHARSVEAIIGWTASYHTNTLDTTPTVWQSVPRLVQM